MEWNEEVVQRVRGAMRDRARVLACMCDELFELLPANEAEQHARKAITRYGTIRAERDGHKMTPDEWTDIHYRDMGGVMKTEVIRNDDFCEMQMHACPLLEEWKALGLSPEKQDLYCDIAMELDRNRAEAHGIPCDIVERMGKGDSFCRVRLWKKPKPQE